MEVDFNLTDAQVSEARPFGRDIADPGRNSID
ncbi:hypothetical protein QBC99_000682 [Beijerinckia sp. GAS462]|nr:hypothetical protein [Beijerinckia sp. GAS462]SEB68745.1 hypothetical protein SAMN05443249_0893 [Beijerinckia sp. 28-YEA-48]